MPGYGLASSDQKRIGSKYMCNSCDMLLRDAVQTACGHIYCSSCLGNLVIDGTSKMTCLQDRQELLPNQVFPDNFTRREVRAFIVHCTFMDDGCKWKGEVRHLESHTNSCEFLEIPCVHPECGLLVKKADLAEHLEKTCKCRLERCGFCKQQISLNKMKLHQERECAAYPVVCEMCNKDGIPRSKLLEHQEPVFGDCDGVQGPCPFAQIACSKTEVLNRRQQKEHLEQENTYHTTLVLQYALRMSREMEALLTRDPRMMSRNPHSFTNYDGVISDPLAQHSGRYREPQLEQVPSLELQGTVQGLARELADVRAKVGRLEQQLEAQENKSKDFQDECRAERQRGYDDRRMESAYLQSRMDHLQAGQDNLRDSRAGLQASQTDVLASHADLEASPADLQASQADLQASHADWQASHADLQASHAHLQGQVRGPNGEGQ